MANTCRVEFNTCCGNKIQTSISKNADLSHFMDVQRCLLVAATTVPLLSDLTPKKCDTDLQVRDEHADSFVTMDKK